MADADERDRDDQEAAPRPEQRLELRVAALCDLLEARGLVTENQIAARCRELAAAETAEEGDHADR